MHFAELISQGKIRAAFKAMAPIIVGSQIKKRGGAVIFHEPSWSNYAM